MDEQFWLNNVKEPFINEEINRNIFLEWVDEFNIEEVYTGIPLWPKLHGRKFQQITTLSDSEKIPFSRKCEMYVKQNGSKVLVAHFYGERMSEVDESDVEEFAYIRGLDIFWMAYDESWLNPGVSTTAVFEISDLDKYLKYIDSNRKYEGTKNRHWI